MTIIIPPQYDSETSNIGVLFCLPQFKPWNALSKADLCLGSVTRRLLLGGIPVTAAVLLHLCPTSAWHVLTKFNPLIPAHLRQTAATNTIAPTLNRNTNHKVRLLRLSDWLEVRGSILSVPNVSSGRGNSSPELEPQTPLAFCTLLHQSTSPSLSPLPALPITAQLLLHFSRADLEAVAASAPIP